MESSTYRNCKITFNIEKIKEGYRGKGKVYCRDETKSEIEEIIGKAQETEAAAREDIMKKFRNFVSVGIAKNFPEKKAAEKNKDIRT